MNELFAVFGINWKLLLVQMLNFGILLAVLTYFLYKPILRLIDERRKKIEEGVQNAEEAQRRLATSASEGKTIVNNASREAEKILTGARERAEEREDELVRQAEARADALVVDAAERAEETKRQALKESEREIARAAMLAAERIMRGKSA